MVLARKIMKFFHERENEERGADRGKRADTEVQLQQVYAGFAVLSACDPFLSSDQNVTPVCIVPQIQ